MRRKVSINITIEQLIEAIKQLIPLSIFYSAINVIPVKTGIHKTIENTGFPLSWE